MGEGELFADVDELLKLSLGFREKIEFAEKSWTNESDALRLFESQLDVFETIRDLVSNKKYVEAFILNRSIFENYFLISLILKGTKYKLRYNVLARSGETQNQAYSRLSTELEKQRAEGRRDIVSYMPVKKHKQIEIVHTGLYSKQGDKLIPIYHFVFEEYDPIRHRIDKIPSIASTGLFAKSQAEWQKKHEALLKNEIDEIDSIVASLLQP